MQKEVIILGAGGHAKVIADIIQKRGDIVLGFLDDKLEIQGKEIFDKIKVLGPIKDIKKYKDKYFIIGIGNNLIRKQIDTNNKLKLYTAIHPNAVISSDVTIGEGTVVMAGSVINPGTKVGRNCIINTSSSLDHDNNISDYVHISPGSHLCGTVNIGECTWICSGVTVINNVSIGKNNIIGANALVLKNINDSDSTYIGIPAKKLKHKNILFLSLLDINLNNNSIYGSILKELSNNNLFIVSPIERRNKQNTYIEEIDNNKILHIKIGNITKTNIIEKGISTLLIENQYKKEIQKYFKDTKFDLILYATPPITFCNVIKYFKKRDNAKTYLMLKDIFPQNAVDLHMFTKKSIFYKFFRKKEINLYNISDKIGCMSLKNKEYLLKNNTYLDKNKIEIFPNSISVTDNNNNIKLKKEYRKKYNIPMDATTYIYGGSLGKPQGIDFIIDTFKEFNKLKNTYLIICGNGTGYKKIEENINENKYNNIILIKELDSDEYNKFINIADVGLVFLDYRFTIPNFPSRILSYMNNNIPILSCTDKNTDLGDIIKDNNFGWKCLSNDVNKYINLIKKINKIDKKELEKLGKNGKKYLINNYNSKLNCEKILKFMNAK